jgi:amino acid adenylation domain-containing protein
MQTRNYSRERDWAAAQFDKERDYWLSQLSGELGKTVFPYDFPGTGQNKDKDYMHHINFKLEGPFFSSLMRVSNHSDVRLFVILLAGLMLILNKYTSHHDIIVGIPIYKQDIEGNFVNTVLAVRNEIRSDQTVKELLKQLAQTVFEANENQNYPIETLLYKLNISFDEKNFPLFDTAVLLENLHDREYLRDIHLNTVFSFLRTDEAVKCKFEYNCSLFKGTTVERVIKHFKQILETALSHLDSPLSALGILTDDEKKQLLVDFNDNNREFSKDVTISRLFEKYSEHTPGGIAVTLADTQLTYGQINENANRLARYLQDSGVREDHSVGIRLDRSTGMVECILAVWKAGGAYIPIDVEYPDIRVLEILQDANTRILISSPGFVDSKPGQAYDGKIIDWSEVRQENPVHCDRANPGIKINMNSLAYVIYTSGSTGKPKGAMVEHIGMMNHIGAKVDDLQLSGRSVVVQNASHTFDISVWQFFAALTLGGKTVIYSNRMVLEPEVLIDRLIKDRVNILEVVPSYLSVMLDFFTEAAHGVPLPLDYLLVTGEAVKPGLVKQWFEKYPGIKMVNAYGPTEVSDDITHYIMDKVPDAVRISIGMPVQNLNIYIVDGHTHLCPIGISGEICVSGVGVGRGYLNDVEKTVNVFGQDPFIEEKGVRLYKTGDLGFWLPNGTIEFLGRKDHQVKIRGFRIELGEIENKLAAYPSVKEAVVIEREDEAHGGKYLCAYLVPGKGCNLHELKMYLSGCLPAYMVPAHLVELEELPLTPNGKINRKALPVPSQGSQSTLPYITREELEKLKKEAIEKIKQVGTGKDDTTLEKVVGPGALTREERERLLKIFNDTTVHYPTRQSIHEIFENQVDKSPAKVILVYKDTQIVYSLLNQCANQLARVLRTRGVKADSIVGLKADRSVEMVVGMFAIWKAGGAYLPIGPEYPPARIRKIAADSNFEILLTDEEESTVLPGGSTIIAITDIENLNKENPANLSPLSTAADLAVIFYTSGSTGIPKGVLVEHYSITNFINVFTDILEYKERDISLSLSTISFDMSCIELYPTLTNGVKVVIGGFEEQVNPDAAGALMARELITIFQITPSHIKLFLSDETFVQTLKLLRFLLLGAEKLSDELRDQLKSFTKARLFNLYGPSEITVLATFKEVTDKAAVTIGKPIPNAHVYILDTNGNLQPIGVSGEMHIGGIGVARGYLGKPSLTAERFTANPFVKGERLYHTGDMAYWLDNGDIQFDGRVDNQVKIGGFRIELEEIETHLVGYESIREAAVVLRDDSHGEKTLYAYIVSEGTLKEAQFREYLTAVLPIYMTPSFIVQLEKMPLTSSRKLDRKLLQWIEIKDVPAVGFQPPRTDAEKKLVEIWSRVLAIEDHRISIDANFFDLGGHSLKAAVLISRIHKELNVKLPMAALFKTPTIKGLSQQIKQLKTEQFCSIPAAEKKEYYCLSSAQKRLYLLRQMDLNSVGYNMPQMVELKGELDKDKLEQTFKKLIRHHESLRTSFQMVGKQPVQRIHYHVKFQLEYDDLGNDNMKDDENEAIDSIFQSSQIETILGKFVRPFDLLQPPFLRVGLVKLRKASYILMTDMHHIITDGTSGEILLQEFMAIYAGKELSALALQYKDYSEWQTGENQRGTIKHQEKYWLKQFEREAPVLNLPTDYLRPTVQSFEGDHLAFELSVEQTMALKALALKTGASLFMVLLAIYNILLSHISDQEDIVVGTPVAGRRHVELEKIVGMFVSTLALRNAPESWKTCRKFLEDVKDMALKAFENQDYPFEELVEKITSKRDISRNPLFDVMFSLQNQGITRLEISGLKLLPFNYEFKTSKFDLSLQAVELEEKLAFSLVYSTKLFRKETIEKFIGYFKAVVFTVTRDPETKIIDVEILSPQEKNQLLIDFNDTAVDYPGDKPLYQLFEEEALKNPDQAALVGKQGKIGRTAQLTYSDLDRRSSQLAHILIKKGVTIDTIVGIMAERSLEMIIGILGILKAGGAYLPLDPLSPISRTKFILEDSRSSLLVTQNCIVHKDNTIARDFPSDRIVLLENETIYPADISDRAHTNKPETLAYVLYTSGTTGNPRGVMVAHGNVNNLVNGLNLEIYRFYHKKLNIGLVAPYIFDASVKQIFAALLLGHTLFLIPEKVRLDGKSLISYYRRHQIEVSDGTPSHLRLLIECFAENGRAVKVKHFIIGGEALFRKITEKFFVKFDRSITKVTNIYGPTECTVDSTLYEVDQENCDMNSTIPIGKPMPNCQVYIVNKAKRLQAIGIPGELCIGGAGVSRGYLNNQELTTEKFDHDKKFLQGSPRGAVFTKSAPPGRRRQRIYKTGDLARWLKDGNVEFLGRMDHQVKIRGYRIELEEIEKCLLKHKKIKEAVVITREGEYGDKYLCAYIWGAMGPGKIPGVAQLKEFLANQVPAYMVPTFFVPLEQLPLTPNGKIDRKRLPEPTISIKKGSSNSPRDEVEEKLAKIWWELLFNKDEQYVSPDIDDNFFGLGGDSLNAAIMAAMLHKTFEVKISLADVFKTPTIREMAQKIRELAKYKYLSIGQVEEKEYYPLSPAQRRLYIIQQMDTKNVSYHMTYVFSLVGKLDIRRFEETYRRLIIRHESLRTSFRMINGEPVQWVHSKVQFNIEYFNIPEAPDEIIKGFIRPFDLSQAPLLRIGLIKINENQHTMVIDMHHIIGDGSSRIILEKEFTTIYQEKELCPLRVRYRDYSQWQIHHVMSESLKEQERYWLNEFKGELPVLNIPKDYDQSGFHRFDGSSYHFEIPGEDLKKMKTLAQQQGVTIFILLTAVFNVMLSKISGQEDIIIGTLTTGRSHADLQSIIGMFANTLALRNYPAGEKVFIHFLQEIKERVLKVFENQDYQFESLIEIVEKNRDFSKNPLFDVMFVLQNFDERGNTGTNIPGLQLKSYEFQIETTQFDMHFFGSESNDTINFIVTYNSRKFKEETINIFVEFLKEVIHSILEYPWKKLAEIQVTPKNKTPEMEYPFNEDLEMD